MLKPNVDDTQRKISAFLNNEYIPDLLLQSVADFVDINDIATVNTMSHDLASLYVEMQKKSDSYITKIDAIVSSTLLNDKQAK